MRVVCDNCGASYKIPESKLVKEVNKATCRKCGNAILIRRVTAPVKSAPSEGTSPDERTQITSAADLERQARSRTGAFEENAGAAALAEAPQGEETVPRDEGPPPRRPAGASTDPGGAAAVPKPIPPMAPPKAPPARPPVAPAAALAATPAPTPAPVRPPALQNGPNLNEERPAPIPPPVSALPPAPAPGAGKGDLLLTLGGVIVGFFGAAAVVGGAVLNTPVLGLVGIFLLLFCLMFMLILLISGGFGKRPASKLGATAGGLFAGSLGAVAWLALWGVGAVTPSTPVASTTPAPAPTPTPVAIVEPTPAPPPVEAPVAAPVPEPVPEPVVAPPPTPEPKAPEDPAAKAKAEEEARLKAEAKAEAKAKADADAKAKADAKAAAKAEADAAARITPTPKAEPTTTTTTTAKTPTTSSGSTLSVQAVATMVNSNKGVKLCYLKEANRTGAVPHAKVKVTVTPTGKATKALAVGEHAGTEFGNCLSSAITAITFPPFDGETTTITYAN